MKENEEQWHERTWMAGRMEEITIWGRCVGEMAIHVDDQESRSDGRTGTKEYKFIIVELEFSSISRLTQLNRPLL